MILFKDVRNLSVSGWRYSNKDFSKEFKDKVKEILKEFNTNVIDNLKEIRSENNGTIFYTLEESEEYLIGE